EENNIVWARQLERAGVHVFYGSVGLKTHAKVILVVRQEEGQIRRYVHLSTGNYNVTTSRLYTDLGMLTADQVMGEDVSEVFNALSGFAKVAHYRKLAVAPVTLAETVLRKISEQTERARAGKPARIYAKMNALVDLPVIDALYAASQAGVPVALCIRGICCLRPGLEGVSENVRVFSVVGRFLEHTRGFAFGVEEDEEMFLASADWMPRNLYRRVELMFPVEDRPLRARIHREVIEPSLVDNSRARDLQPDGTYVRRSPAPREPGAHATVEGPRAPAAPAAARGPGLNTSPRRDACSTPWRGSGSGGRGTRAFAGCGSRFRAPAQPRGWSGDDDDRRDDGGAGGRCIPGPPVPGGGGHGPVDPAGGAQPSRGPHARPRS